jgi:hypothetical protein
MPRPLQLSSAHVYLRLPPEVSGWESIPEALLIDCAQLVKVIYGKFISCSETTLSLAVVCRPIRLKVMLFARRFSGRSDGHILGNKKDNIAVIYCPCSNLKKDGSMATGQGILLPSDNAVKQTC